MVTVWRRSAPRSFFGNDLSSVTIPQSVTSIGHSAFGTNPNLGSVRFLCAAPTLDTESFGVPWAGPTLYHPVGEPVYESPTWLGYDTQAFATVTFDMVGGAPAAESQYVDVGGLVVAPASPSKSGFVFVGWNDGESAYDFGC